jgi:hypothetical protein
MTPRFFPHAVHIHFDGVEYTNALDDVEQSPANSVMQAADNRGAGQVDSEGVVQGESNLELYFTWSSKASQNKGTNRANGTHVEL